MINSRWSHLDFFPATDSEVTRIRMMESKCGDASLWIHHESFGQLHSKMLQRLKQSPDHLLRGEIGAGGIPEGITLAGVLGLEHLHAGHRLGIRAAPAGANLSVGSFCQSFSHLHCECLQRM